MNQKEISSLEVYALTSMIPKGMVGTYGDIAKALGKEGSSRVIGRILHINPYAPRVPCHRVVRSNGRVGGFAKGVRSKIEMLEAEGVKVSSGIVVDFTKVRFRGFSKPLPKI